MADLPAASYSAHMPCRTTTQDSATCRSARLVIVTRVDGLIHEQAAGVSCVPTNVLGVLTTGDVPLIFVSESMATDVRDLQQQLDLTAPFICEKGAALYIPPAYFGDRLAGREGGRDRWEVFRFNPADTAAAIRLLCGLFAARGEQVLTVGLGCDHTDYPLLTAVDVPIVVRDDHRDQESLLRGVPGAYLTSASGAAGWSEALIGAPSQ